MRNHWVKKVLSEQGKGFENWAVWIQVGGKVSYRFVLQCEPLHMLCTLSGIIYVMVHLHKLKVPKLNDKFLAFIVQAYYRLTFQHQLCLKLISELQACSAFASLMSFSHEAPDSVIVCWKMHSFYFMR